MSPDLQLQLADCLQSLGLSAVDVEGVTLEQGQSLSLITDEHLEDSSKEVESSENKGGNVVSWSPPTQNWNPWTGCNIDEGPLASVPLETISQV